MISGCRVINKNIKTKLQKEGLDLLTYLNGSETAVVVLHEIYGLNQHIEEFCLQLSKQQFDVFAPNLLQSEKAFAYEEEDLAYNNFFTFITFERALKQVTSFLQVIRSKYTRIFVIGFSVGATVAWLCSKEADLCDGVIGFYGSRIRDYLVMEPKCPVLLFVPAEEISFEVNDFTHSITNKSNVSVIQLNGLHGFADPFSPDYNKQSSDEAYKQLIHFLRDA